MAATLKSKLTSEQIQNILQELQTVVLVGNGEPSLRQSIRDNTKSIDEIHQLLTKHIQQCDDNDRERKLEKEKTDQEKYLALLSQQNESKANRAFWARTVGVLMVTQVVQWFFTGLAVVFWIVIQYLN